MAFDQYAQWHPVLSLGAKPEQVVVGAEIPGHISGGDAAEQDVTMRIGELPIMEQERLSAMFRCARPAGWQ